jgi:rhamnose transport system permease protein
MSEKTLLVEKPWSWKAFFFQWEWLLFAVLVLVNIINSFLSP